MSITSLTPQLVSLNDKFNRAHWSLTPRDIDEEICKDIIMSGNRNVKDAAFEIGGMTARDLNYYRDQKRDPLHVMFSKIREKKSENCQILCNDPDKHFSEKVCFPIYKVYQKVKAIDSNAAKHFTDPTMRQQVKENIEAREKLFKDNSSLEDDAYPIYHLSEDQIKNTNIKKSIILTIDFVNLEEFDGQSDTTYYTGLTNLLENINKNFTCMLSPQFNKKEKDNWFNFVSTQINNSNFIILVMTPKMIEVLQINSGDTDSLFGTCPSTDLTGDKQPSISMGLDADSMNSLKLLWTKIKQSNKPLASVVFDNDLEMSANSLVSVVFYLPRNTRLLLGYLLHRLHDF